MPTCPMPTASRAIRPFSAGNYQRADSTSFHFEAKATDQSLGVFGHSDDIETTAVITSR